MARIVGIVVILLSTCNPFSKDTHVIEERLNLSHKDIAELPDSCLSKKYRKIDISYNRFEVLPVGWLEKQDVLEDFYGPFNNFKKWPIVSLETQKLSKIDLQANQIDEIPTDISLLHSLKTLSLKENKISFLPDEIWLLDSLEDFNVSFNYIREVHPLRKMSSVHEIDLQSNEIVTVSKDLFLFPNLRYLNLADNKISKLPFDTIPRTFDALILAGNPISEEERSRIMTHNPEAYFIVW